MGSFAQDISTFVQKTKVKGDVVMRKLALDGLRGVVMKTPVDTGRARGNWRVAINRVDLTIKSSGFGKEKIDGGSPEANGAAAAQLALNAGNVTIGTAKWTDSISISNNLPYIRRLEAGWSKQAPAGMLAITFASLKAQLAAIVKGLGSAAPVTASPSSAPSGRPRDAAGRFIKRRPAP